MRVALTTLLALVLVAGASAKTAPTYSVTFTGAGTEHYLDQQQNVQDSGLCDSAEHMDVTAKLAWRTTWTGFRAASRSALALPSTPTGTFSGTHVKDACGLPLDQAPDGWVSESACPTAPLVAAGSPALDVQRLNAGTLLVGVAATPLAVPVGAGCAVNIRNSEYVAHVVVSAKKLSALKKRGSLTFTVGTLAGGAHDLYRPSDDCSQPTKPYEGYRTEDHCRDDVQWSGTVTITRVS